VLLKRGGVSPQMGGGLYFLRLFATPGDPFIKRGKFNLNTLFSHTLSKKGETGVNSSQIPIGEEIEKPVPQLLTVTRRAG